MDLAGEENTFMGCEFGQWKEWDFDSALDWELLASPLHSGLVNLVRDLNLTYLDHSGWGQKSTIGRKNSGGLTAATRKSKPFRF